MKLNLDAPTATSIFVPAAQAQILDLLWAKEGKPLTIRQIYYQVRMTGDHERAYTTISAIIADMVKHGWLKRIESTPTTYAPIRGQEAFYQTCVETTLNTLATHLKPYVTAWYITRLLNTKPSKD